MSIDDFTSRFKVQTVGATYKVFVLSLRHSRLSLQVAQYLNIPLQFAQPSRVSYSIGSLIIFVVGTDASGLQSRHGFSKQPGIRSSSDGITYGSEKSQSIGKAANRSAWMSTLRISQHARFEEEAPGAGYQA